MILGGLPVRVLQAYRFALDPTPRQERALASHVGARRFAFNWGLALVKERLEAHARVKTSRCRGPSPPCGGSGTGKSTASPPGGGRTRRKPTPPVWTGSPGPCRTGPKADRVNARGAGWGFPGSGRRAGGGSRCGSPPARSG
ncbi:helix-turn-helix domain-containing protein [Thermaerobacter subterraneus]|uniref:helix-turn-helix domain-containing protein n=1 Tax=Thermaerobacter subterraneus TaxID=175696 RepID=UPI001FA72069|nr:helix-turn-helix domain-containing protein [Thermaerobacter subterraneus]